MAGARSRSAGLDVAATALACRLRDGGVGVGDVVAVFAEPSIELIVGALAVMKAGAAYLLLDPARPPSQLEQLLGDCGARALLATPGLADALVTSPALVFSLGGSDEEPTRPADLPEVSSDAICCLHYTSDAAGRLLGVPIRHAAAANLLTAVAADLGVGPADTVLALATTLFGVPFLEPWLALVAGARAVIAPREVTQDGARVSALISAEKASFLHADAATWRALIDTGMRSARGLRGLSGGGRLPRELADQILERCRALWNGHGAAEAGGYSTLARVERSRAITVGRPIANTQVYVVDRTMRAVGVGVTGELLIAGRGVAPGYHDRPQATAEAFIENPFGPGGAFRTRDLARWLPDGELELVAPPHGGGPAPAGSGDQR